MRVKVKFFAYFRDLFGGRELEVELEAGSTVSLLLDRLCDTPERRREIYSGPGLKTHLVVMVNGIHVLSLSGLRTILSDGDTVAVFPFLAGG
jgi:MoaD family protein